VWTSANLSDLINEARKPQILGRRWGRIGRANSVDFSELERAPNTGELKFFTDNPMVGGMVVEDSVVINPFKQWKPEERNSILTNESIRLFMRRNNIKPKFNVTEEQTNFFRNNRTNTGSNYIDNPSELRETIIARIIAGDPSSGTPTKDQIDIAENIINLLKEKGISGIRGVK